MIRSSFTARICFAICQIVLANSLISTCLAQPLPPVDEIQKRAAEAAEKAEIEAADEELEEL
ncbi:MAG: hypothetical protein AAF989_16225, partial [Planctomycetota bacterium]